MEGEPWLILGGVGYIGRNLVKHLIDTGVTANITVADKAMPMLSHFHPLFETVFSQVEYVQCDLTRTPDKAFNKEYAVIVNCAGETRPAMNEYEHRSKSVGVVESVLPLITSPVKWIELSTAQVYPPDEIRSTEASQTAPYNHSGAFRLEVEQILASNALINYTILRPAIVYGLGDFRGLTNWLVLATVYKKRRERMKLLWNAKLKQNTVHILDMCGAIVHVRPMDSGAVFNVADDANTDQGAINKLLERMFRIKTGFHGKTLSKLALSDIEGVCQEANDKHMLPWTDLCMD
jgi:nucleoside-diphosphate-sugar epimerase